MKTKKISWQAIAIVALALVLIASIALGVSGAWFQDRDAVQQTSKMGEAVTIRLGDTSATDPVDTWSKLYKSTKPYPGDVIMGATNIYMGSTTPSVVRGKIDVSVTKKGAGAPINLKTEVDPSATAPTPVDKTTFYSVVDGVTTFDQSGYDAAVERYKIDAEKYDLKLLAEMLDVTLAENPNWKAGKDTSKGYYYYNAMVKTTDAINLFNQLQLSTELSNEVAEWTIEVKVVVEAIQAANLCDKTGTAVNTEWFNDLPEGSTVLSEVTAYNKTERVVSAA